MTQSATVLSDAFQRAGYVSAAERLRAEALRALRDHPRDFEAAKAMLLRAISGDAKLLWEFLAPVRDEAARKLLTSVMKESRAPAAGGHCDRDNQTLTAPGDSDPKPVAVIGHKRPLPHRPHALAAAAAAASLARPPLLDSLFFNERKLGDCTSTEALDWARSRRRDVRFIELLTSNLPPDRPIREFRRDDETQALYDQAEAEIND